MAGKNSFDLAVKNRDAFSVARRTKYTGQLQSRFRHFIAATVSIMAACCFPCLHAGGQNIMTDSLQKKTVVVNNILIEGNRRTRDEIILREMTFKPGDTLHVNSMMNRLLVSHNQLMNTGLFNEAVVNISRWEHDSINVTVTVKERWYTLPLPTINLYDRNFNVWWVEHNHDIRWIQGGIKFYQKNLSGRNDELRLTALLGFQQRFDATYTLPYFDYIQKHGFRFSSALTRSKSITYNIDSNKELIYQDVNLYQRSVFEASAETYYRPLFHYKYSVLAGYKYSTVIDTIAQLNPDYFLNGATTQQYLSLTLVFERDYRDIIAYPLRGNYLQLAFSKLGLGLFKDVNIWAFSAAFSQYVPLGGKWYFGTQDKMKLSFPTDQPYNLERGLGYGNDYVSGYEYYAIDGQSFGYAKVNLRNQILKVNIRSAASNPFSKGANLPFAIYGKVYADAGYVSNSHSTTNNPLENQLLLGGGVGIDITLVYDTTLRFEYSVNKNGERGFFFHSNTYF